MNKKLRTWIEVDTQALAHNYETFRSYTAPSVKLGAVVKSNAYGHDFVQCASFLEKCGADYLIVDSITEALRLRKEGIQKPILVLGYTLPACISDALVHDISLTLSHKEHIQEACAIASKEDKVLKAHIKIDTGMHRQGFSLKDASDLFSMLQAHTDTLFVEGVYTHFASAKNPVVFETTEKQIQEFILWKEKFIEGGYTPLFHACATGGTLLYSKAHFDMVRIGIGLYGYFPSREVEAFCEDTITLKPALTWKTIVSEIKSVRKSEPIGYDGAEVLKRDSLVALCPIGYWHGFSRRLSGIGHVLLQGKRVKVLGRVSMDMIVIDSTDIPTVSIGDEVVLLGGEDTRITPYEMAALDETSWYETITRINPLIKRIYI